LRHSAAPSSHVEFTGPTAKRFAPAFATALYTATAGEDRVRERDTDKSNKSANRPFGDVLFSYRSRRDVLRGGLQSAAAAFFVSSPVLSLAARKPRGKARPGLMDFAPLPVTGGGGRTPRIAPDYQMQVLIPWGEAINPESGPAFAWPPRPADQEKQVGIGHDGMWFFPLDDSSDRGLLVLNHEYGMNAHILGRNPASLDDVRVAQNAHGITVVELSKR
jgi:secreted PhoX family phosphatase